MALVFSSRPIKMSPRFVLGRENVPCVAEVVNRSLKADCTDFNINDNGYLDWLFHQNVFPLRESNSVLSGEGKGCTFEELFRSVLSELAFEFDCNKELKLKVLIQIHQTSKTS